VRQVVAAHPKDGHQVEVRAQPVIAEVDASKLERIVENLLANAIKHTPPGTDVAVRVQPDGDALLIAVDDRGTGVPEPAREAVFELFNRGGAFVNVPGAGVGLALVAQFAAMARPSVGRRKPRRRRLVQGRAAAATGLAPATPVFVSQS
jgi:signal transduction histidine kinase